MKEAIPIRRLYIVAYECPICHQYVDRWYSSDYYGTRSVLDKPLHSTRTFHPCGCQDREYYTEQN